MIKFIVQFLIFLLLFWSNKKAKGQWLTPSGVLLFIYAFCSFMALFVLMSGEYWLPLDRSYWIYMLEFDLFLVAFLLPFKIFNESKVDSIRFPSRVFLDVFSVIIIILSFYSIFFFAGSVRHIFSLADLGAARDALQADGVYFETGLAATVASVAAANYCFALILFFIYKIIDQNSFRCTLLLISSLSNVMHVLAFVGRDGVVFWIFTFLFCYSLFRPYLQIDLRKNILRPMLWVVVVLLVPFLLISVGRFTSSETGIGGSFVSYLGHAFVQGPLFFGIDNKPYKPGSAFPLYYEITGARQPFINSRLILGEWISWKFSTFVVSLYLSLGFGGLVTAAVGMFLLFQLMVGTARRTMDFGQITIYTLYFAIFAEGVFYFRQYTKGGQHIYNHHIGSICDILCKFENKKCHGNTQGKLVPNLVCATDSFQRGGMR